VSLPLVYRKMLTVFIMKRLTAGWRTKWWR